MGLRGQVTRSVGGPSHLDDAAAFKRAIQDRLSEIGIVKHLAPDLDGLARTESR